MSTAYSLTPELRRKLKEPIGTLIRGSPVETMNKVKEIVDNESPRRIISVGDTVTKNLVRKHLLPQLMIIDNRAMRRSLRPTRLPTDKVIYVKNPAGTITEEACAVIRETLESCGSVKIIIDGEEDLLALVAVSYAPEHSLVIYGQPYEGVVVVKVTPQKKAEVADILKLMKNVRKAK